MANPQHLSCVTPITLLQDQDPPPDFIEGEEEYEIEAIMSHKKWGQGYWYLIK